MCGIAGFIDFNNRSSLEILKKGTDVLQHRGPDGSGYEFFQLPNSQVGLGHRRLSIIDLSEAGRQPMWYKHWCMVFNGEMYNYATVKAELAQLGHQFVSHSDTEVVLHAWEQWGPEMIHRFVGMFTLVIYDSQQHTLVAYRDRAGVKPFYYYWHEGLFLFASELKSFHQHPGFKKVINPQAVQQFLQYGYILAPLSIFQHTHKLLPGHYLRLEAKGGEPQLQKYWDIYEAYNRPKLQIDLPDAIKETQKMLIEACQYRMVADVPVGVFLSGGYDSSAVTALLQANRTDQLKTYTIGFHEEDHNEAVYAKAVAQHLGTDHTEYYCTTQEAQEIIPEIPFYCDEPFGDSSIIPTTLVSRLARKEVIVALSADAGDETFAGYNKYPLALNLLKKIETLPAVFRSPAGRLLNKIPGSLLAKVSGSSAAPIKRERLAKILQHGKPSACVMMDYMLGQMYTTNQLNHLLVNNTTKAFSFYDTEAEMGSHLGQLDRMLAMDYKTYMVDDILVKVDRATMSTSLEGREPLLDHRLAEWVAQLPPEYKMRGIEKKFLLKEIVHDYLPKDMMDRPKMGFGVPVFHWLRHELKFYADEYMSEAAFAQHGLFKKEGVQHIIQHFFAGDKNYNSLFWYLLMFQMWYKKWMA
jgi:asparagine synthase (glutamine-hydrolysing)